MPKFVIESPHTKEECLHTLDEVLQKGPAVLHQFQFGCAAGDHTAYAIVDTKTDKDAWNMVPESVRQKAHVQSVSEITPDQIRSYHQK